MIKIKVASLEGRLLFSQPEQSKKFSKSSDWLKKGRHSQKATFVLMGDDTIRVRVRVLCSLGFI